MPPGGPKDTDRLVSVSKALRLGLGLTATGVLLVLGSAIYSDFIALWSNNQEASSYKVILLLGTFLLALGITIVFSLAVRVSALGAGQFKLLGIDFPIEFQGAMFVLVTMLLTMGYAVNFMGLLSLEEERIETKIAAVSEEVKEKSAATIDQLEGIIKNYLDRGLSHRIQLRFSCDQGDRYQTLRWREQAAGGQRVGVLLTTSQDDNSTSETTSAASTGEDFEMLEEDSLRFKIVHTFDGGSGMQTEEVISGTFIKNDDSGLLVVTIWPEQKSLVTVCDELNGKLGAERTLPGTMGSNVSPETAATPTKIGADLEAAAAARASE
jgi:hypothetical protein